MRYHRLKNVSFILILALWPNRILLAEEQHTKPKNLENIQSHIEKVVGLGNMNALNEVVKADVSPRVDKIPFLHKKIKSINLCVAEYDDIKLRLKSAPIDLVNQHEWKLSTLVDPNSLQTLDVTLERLGYEGSLIFDPNAHEIERMLSLSDEAFTGLPDTDPNINFMEALNIVYTKGIGNPYQAKEIDAYYVLHSVQGSEPYPAWIITLKGIPPIAHILRYNPDAKQCNIRNVVDARTGELLFAVK